MATQGYGPSALLTPANAITLTRVVLTPLLVALIIGEDTRWAAFGLWLALAATDGADGWVARRHGTTRSGAFLDPLADKIVVLSAMAALVSREIIWWVPVVIIGLRELIVSAYRSVVGRQGISVPARPLAKLKTVFQDIAVGLAIVPVAGSAYAAVVNSFLWTGVILTIVTGVQYLWDGRRVIRAL